MTDKTLPTLVAASNFSGTDIILSRIGGDTEDSKLPGSVLLTYMQANLTDSVASVFGRTGTVTATSGDYTTAQVTEVTNLYFTNARAIASTLTGYASGAGTISSTDTILTAIQKLNGNTAALTTAAVPDSSNKRYVTDAQLTVIGNTSGTNTGDQTSVTGNAGTATALQTARAIGGVNFDGTAAITPTQIQPAAENSDTTCFITFFNSASGTAQQPKYNSSLIYNASTGILGSTGFAGDLTGNVTGNVSGSSGSCTGNAATVTTNANLTGDVTSVGNTTAIAAGVIVDADINASAAIAVTKMAALTVSRAMVTDASGFNSVSATTATELSYVNGVTSAIQTQLGNKAPVNSKVRTIGFSTTAPATGQQGTYIVFPVAGTITGYKIVADAGTCTVKTWKIASGTTAPTVANLISTSGVALATGTAIISSTTSDFTSTAVSANDIFAFDLSAFATATKILFELEITVT